MMTKLTFDLCVDEPAGAKRPHTWRAEIYFAGVYIAGAWADSRAEAKRRAVRMVGEKLHRLVEGDLL
jgi:hypothetical protein